MAAGSHLGKFRMAISLQRIIRSTSCLILGWGSWGRRIEWRYFRLHQIQDGGQPPSWKISNGHISRTGRLIDFVSDPRVGFSGTADRMDLLPLDQIQDGGWLPSWKISDISGTGRPIVFVFDPMVGFLGTADRMAIFPVAPNPRWRPAAILENFKWPYLRNGSSDRLYVWF